MATMAMNWKLKEYLDRHDITPYRLAKESGLALSTVYSLTNTQPERLDMNSLDTIMDTLERITGQPVPLSELLERGHE